MIVKIMQNVPNEVSGGSYTLFDGVDKVVKVGIFEKSGNENRIEYYDYSFMLCDDEPQYSQIMLDRGEESLSIVTDCVVYVLNDSGTTIDRIIPKH